MVMDVAVITAKTWPVRETRNARMGSVSGIPTGAPPDDPSAVAASNKLCSTGLMAGVWGVRGVRGVPGMVASKLEAESTVKKLALSVVSWPGDGMGMPSWETVTVKADGELLEVANMRGVPTGQYIARAISRRGVQGQDKVESSHRADRRLRSPRRREYVFIRTN